MMIYTLMPQIKPFKLLLLSFLLNFSYQFFAQFYCSPNHMAYNYIMSIKREKSNIAIETLKK